MQKFISAAIAATVLAFSTPAFATGNNETSAQLLCTESAIANMIVKTSGIQGEKARRMAREELAAAHSDVKAQRRAECIAHVQNAMKFFRN
jgi:hypothetical protein